MKKPVDIMVHFVQEYKQQNHAKQDTQEIFSVSMIKKQSNRELLIRCMMVWKNISGMKELFR